MSGAPCISGGSARLRRDMAEHIDGPLYYERMGRARPVMAFVHPNFRKNHCRRHRKVGEGDQVLRREGGLTLSLPLKGGGRSPKATRWGFLFPRTRCVRKDGTLTWRAPRACPPPFRGRLRACGPLPEARVCGICSSCHEARAV